MASGTKVFLAQIEDLLLPFDEMLIGGPFLLGERPRFVDFDLFGMIENFLYSGHYKLPAAHTRLRQWYRRLGTLKFKDLTREKLRP